MPQNTTKAQWEQIGRAIDYAKTKGVDVIVTKVR
jgi:hypothetical protein